jgi:hypothetical protein
MPSDPYDLVALREQSRGQTAADHAAGPGDRDPH